MTVLTSTDILGENWREREERERFCKQHSTLNEEIQTNVCVYIMPQTMLRGKEVVFNCFTTRVKTENTSILFKYLVSLKKSIKYMFFNNLNLLINELIAV